MKHSERITIAESEARLTAGAHSKNAIAYTGFTVAAALLEIARQIAITREESQNGKPSPFDRK